MSINELREMLENSNDRLSILNDDTIIKQYTGSMFDFLKVVNDFLSDEEKSQLFQKDLFINLPNYAKVDLVSKYISDSTVKYNMIKNSKFLENIECFQLVALIRTMNDEKIIDILNIPDFLESRGVSNFNIVTIIKGLKDDSKLELMQNKALLEKLKLNEYDFANITSSIESDSMKLQLLDSNLFSSRMKPGIIITLSDDVKKDIILRKQYGIKDSNIKFIISSMSADNIVKFLNNNKEFLENNSLKPHDIISYLTTEKQVEFISKINEAELSLNDRRLILASIENEAKEKVDKTKLSVEEVEALEMKRSESYSDRSNPFGGIIIDWNSDLEKYSGLDELIKINPLSVSKEDKDKIVKLGTICPKLQVRDNIIISVSTFEEYMNSEAWIDSTLQKINPEWTALQKVAFIDNAIGKKISYSPDHDTEVENKNDCRALWRIINSGYGVCNGIAQVEKYILDRIGIPSEMVSSNCHTFLKLTNIELPTDSGETITGDTILDPTWNLSTQRYGGFPSNFCINYEESRKHDISQDGKDYEAHKNDEALSNVTFSLSESCLRKLYTSIGLADEKGDFPIKHFFEKANEIGKQEIPDEEKIRKELQLFEKSFPGFSTCQNSTMSVLRSIELQNYGIKLNKGVINRVYERDDEKKSPVMYIYLDTQDGGKKFYYADKQKDSFVEMSVKEFEKKFECYENDIMKNNGRPWEDKRIVKEEDLTKSSGKVIAKDSNERGEI